eukprot:m.37905 g.37905  ORF g.37905 m.37905 type:complete len:211 (+) comp7755_c0_seq2:3244-3876(+)
MADNEREPEQPGTTTAGDAHVQDSADGSAAGPSEGGAVELHAQGEVGLGEEDDDDEPRRPRSTSGSAKRSRSDVEVETPVKKPAVAIDREKRCPFLLRVFVRTNGQVRREEFTDPQRLPDEELQVYTWMDATLSELASLIMEVDPAPRRRRANLRFSTVYRSSHMGKPTAQFRDLGRVTVGQEGPDDAKALRDTAFKIGDMLAVSVMLPR